MAFSKDQVYSDWSNALAGDSLLSLLRSGAVDGGRDEENLMKPKPPKLRPTERVNLAGENAVFLFERFLFVGMDD